MKQDQHTTVTELYTLNHIYRGLLENRGHRLADLLNTATTNIVELLDVSIRSAAIPQADPLQCERLQVKKDQILMARPIGGYEAPMRRVYCYVDKPKYYAQVVLPGYVLRGTIYMPERANAMFILREGGVLPSYVAITGVKVQPAATGLNPFDSPVMIFCRHLVEAAEVLACSKQQVWEQEVQATEPDTETLEEIEKLIDSLKSSLSQTFATTGSGEEDANQA